MPADPSPREQAIDLIAAEFVEACPTTVASGWQRYVAKIAVHTLQQSPGVLAVLAQAARPSDEEIRLAWHDACCPEAEDCRDRALHAAAQTIVNSGVVHAFLTRLGLLEDR